MSEQNDLLYGAYGRFADAALARVRAETFGRDIGQNSWITVDEYERFLAWLELEPDARVLEVACGSGGPARHLAEHARCRVIGIDAHSQGIETATRLAQASSGADRVRFEVADVDRALPFEAGINPAQAKAPVGRIIGGFQPPIVKAEALGRAILEE